MFGCTQDQTGSCCESSQQVGRHDSTTAGSGTLLTCGEHNNTCQILKRVSCRSRGLQGWVLQSVLEMDGGFLRVCHAEGPAANEAPTKDSKPERCDLPEAHQVPAGPKSVQLGVDS